MTPVLSPPPPVEERGPVAPDGFAALVADHRPVVLRGQVSHWAAVAAGQGGDRAMAAYLAGFDGGRPLDVMIAPPEAAGRFLYADERCAGFNFHRQKVGLAPLVGQLLRYAETGEAAPHALYANSATAPEHLPGWETANPLGLPVEAPARLWIGNGTRIAPHYDTSFNIACVVAGRRRFTLFPPDQWDNLYVGPLDNTVAGPPNALTDPDEPDLARFPRFADALAQARVAELAPGDALFMPPLWWHHVRATGALNVLVNYWWGHRSGDAFVALIHAVGTIRDLPPAERDAWRGWFDRLVFDADAAHAADHLPEAARGVLGPDGAARTARIDRFLLGMLSRRVGGTDG